MMGFAYIADKRWLRDKLNAKSDCTSNTVNLCPDRDWDVEPVRNTEEEFE